MNKPKRQKMPGWVTGRGMDEETWKRTVIRFLDDIATGKYEYLSIVQLPFPRWCEEEAAIGEVRKLVDRNPRLKMVKNYAYLDFEIRLIGDDRLEGTDPCVQLRS